MRVVWLPRSALLALHGELCEEHGSLSGTVNEGLLEATLARPQQRLAYAEPAPTLFELAAAYGFGFARNHCFTDGNKRVALVAIDVFLQLNGYELVAPELEAVKTILSLAAGELSEQALARWIERNAVPQSQPDKPEAQGL